MLKEAEIGDDVFCVIDYQGHLFTMECDITAIKPLEMGFKATVNIKTGGKRRAFELYNGDLFRTYKEAERERKKREKYE